SLHHVLDAFFKPVEYTHTTNRNVVTLRASLARRARVAERQTRWLQVPVSERAWGFKSPLAHQGERSSWMRALSCVWCQGERRGARPWDSRQCESCVAISIRNAAPCALGSATIVAPSRDTSRAAIDRPKPE